MIEDGPVYRNPTQPVARRVEDLLTRMTPAEKIGQLNQVFVVPENREQITELIRQGGVGSRIIATSHLAGSTEQQAAEVEDLNDLQRIAVEETRLGIPLIHGRDIIHGHRTVFPIPLALAAMFDEALVEEAFAVAAREAASAGVHWSFAPMLDIARDPRWGRVVEGFGEDPYLASRLAIAAVHGFQGDDPAAPDRVLACAKHYVGYGAAEGGRDYNTAEISDTTLRNVYLAPFRAAVDAGVGSVMSAFHDLNGEPATGSFYLLTEILKHELGFQGFVVSDWASVAELVNHRVAADRCDAARIALMAGVDMDMVCGCFQEHLAGLLERGAIDAARLDDAVRRVLGAKFRLGLFERPYTDPQAGARVQFAPEHRALARRIAARAAVLLENRGLLPLTKEARRIAVIGPLAQERRALLGSWVLDGIIAETQTLVEAVAEVCPQAEILSASRALSDEMLMRAAEADVVILAVGESDARNGEYNNVAELRLPAGQDELIEAVVGLEKPFIVVVLSGRPVVLNRAARQASALLWAWHPGSMGAAGIADVLFGDAEPGGRLPLTFPRSTGHVPIHYNHRSTGRPAMSRYHDMPATPLYRFGSGLGYTTFTFSDIVVSAATIAADGHLTVSALVTNTGLRAGETVAQCYVRDDVASITRPVRELKGFARVALAPGESRRVAFDLGPAELGFYGRHGRWRVEPGTFTVWVGADSSANLEARFTVAL